MRSNLTFAGFLCQYVRELSGADTFHMRRLLACCDDNPRLREPLYLYAMVSGKLEVLQRALPRQESTSYFIFHEWLAVYSDLETVLARLQSADEALPERFVRVWKSYVAVRDRTENENHLKSLMREKAIELLAAKKVSNYRVYTDLGLNPGNTNAWLKHADNSKMSLSNARSILTYAKQA